VDLLSTLGHHQAALYGPLKWYGSGLLKINNRNNRNIKYEGMIQTVIVQKVIR